MPAPFLTDSQDRAITERLGIRFTAARNRARLATWVEARRVFAAAKADPDACLMQWHDWLGGEMARLGEDETPGHLIGLTAWDLSQAQLALIRPLTGAPAAPA